MSLKIKTKIWPFIEGLIMQNIFADITVSVSELKKNPTAVMAGAQGQPVAVLNHNRVMGYMVPAELYEAMMEQLEDIELAQLVKARAREARAGEAG
jgi:antitoxin StbD